MQGVRRRARLTSPTATFMDRRSGCADGDEAVGWGKGGGGN
jgi:hypothetical protein